MARIVAELALGAAKPSQPQKVPTPATKPWTPPAPNPALIGVINKGYQPPKPQTGNAAETRTGR